MLTIYGNRSYGAFCDLLCSVGSLVGFACSLLGSLAYLAFRFLLPLSCRKSDMR